MNHKARLEGWALASIFQVNEYHYRAVYATCNTGTFRYLPARPTRLEQFVWLHVPLPRKEHRKVVYDPRTKLVEVLDSAQEYFDLAIKSKDRGEREFFERIVELYVKIAEELEALIGDS